MTVRDLYLNVVLWALLMAWWPLPAQAWMFHEHTGIGRVAIAALNTDEARALAVLWQRARERAGHAVLCTHPAARGAADPHDCIDAPMLPAIAADHSCRPGDLLALVSKRGFLQDVLDVAREAATDIDRANSEELRLERWVASHARMQGADTDYLDRAEVNGAHFLIPRAVRSGIDDYLRRVARGGQDSNAMALYVLYHVAAMRLASESSAHEVPTGQGVDSSGLAVLALMSEAFAQHFLQDAFASGHTTGARGSAAQRMGTHDYYCARGLEVRAWNDPAKDQYVAHGDAHMLPEDTSHAAQAVRDSWKQFLASFALPANPALSLEQARALVGFDACTAEVIPGAVLPAAEAEGTRLLALIGRTPQPVVDDEAAAPARFVKQQGFFVSVFAGAGGDLSFGGYATPSAYGTLAGFQSVGLGAGFDATGVLSRSFDSAYWIQARAVSMGQQAQLDGLESRAPLVMRRMGFELRLRIPFALVPGDGLLAAPLLLANTDFGIRWGLVAAGGGLLGLQRVLGGGSIQFVAGRELGVRWLLAGALGSSDRAAEFEQGVSGLQLDLPLVDLRLFQSFAAGLAMGMLVQAGVGLDLNEVGTGYRVFITAGFDSRYYM